MQATSAITPERIARANKLVNMFAAEWRMEIPPKIHAYGTDSGHGLGGPAFHPEFINWLGPIPHDCSDDECRRERERNNAGRNHDARTRTTRCFRKIRRMAPREFDVLYLLCVNGYTVDEVAATLTERAIRLMKPERYDRTSVFYLLFSALDKAVKFY